MLPAPLFLALDRLLAGQTAARGRLARHAGKAIEMGLPGLALSARITPEGGFAAAETGAVPDTRIELTPGLILRLATGEHGALREARVSGDGLLAADFKRALDGLDLALALKPYLGDVLAARVAGGLTTLRGWQDKAQDGLARSVAEYLVHETSTLASRAAVADFVQAVDRLRDDAARLEARLSILEKKKAP